MKRKILINTAALILITITFTACSRKVKPEYAIYVDMSKAHKSGLFQPAPAGKPEKGAKIFITGNYNNWSKEGLQLTDEDKDFIFKIDLKKITDAAKKPMDSLEFRFNIEKWRMVDGRWMMESDTTESIAIRKIALNDLYKAGVDGKKIVLVFNEVYDVRETAEVTFTVGTSNQKVLGFFKPEEGDKIAITGSFCNWAKNGMIMGDDGDDIYKIKLPVKYYKNKPVEYKYKILTKRNAYLPNEGLEKTTHTINIWSEGNEAAYTEFDNISRVARFIINTEKFEREGKFKPLKGDVLQIKLLLDGKEVLTNPLFRVKTHEYETAVIVPMNIKEVKWSIVTNINKQLIPRAGQGEFENANIKTKGYCIKI
ncbi:MAG: hypothetical protein NTX22_06265 [Ignavibacteriales bacterium]|nr:hypothetical protein [Ignavibacteriales bacterium]